MPAHHPSPSRRTKILVGSLPFLLVVLFYASLNLQGPTPFSYKGDMHLLAAPLARFAAENWAALKVPLIDWNLGDGLNPWLSGQSSVLYPIHPVALLVARALGDPGLLMELTAILDYLVLAYVLMGSPFFRKWSITQRSLIVLLFLVQPSALILGQNWCYFLNSYTWLLLTLHWLLAWGRWPRRMHYAWLGTGSALVLYSAINVQMFAFAMALAILPALLVFRSRIPWARAGVFAGLAAVLVAPSMALLWQASQHSNPAWMRGRESVDAALAFAQPLFVFLNGAISGNYLASPFSVWSGVSWRTVGIFWMAPALPWAMAKARAPWRKPLLWGFLVLVLLMGIASFPFLKWVFLGPFARFRWTWKFAIFLPALLLAVLAALPGSRPAFRGTLVLALSVFLGWGICLRGLQADFMPAARPAAQLGVRGLTGPAREVVKALRLSPGERIAPVGQMASLAEPVPLAWLALAGNGPSLFDVPTLAIYEPLEPEAQATYRGGLSIPWREALPDGMTLDMFRTADEFFGPRGVKYYLFKSRPAFSGPPILELHLQNQETVWIVQSRAWQPWIRNPQGKPGPGPDRDGRWRLPSEGGPWQIATSQTFRTAAGHPVTGGSWIPGGTVLTPRPLGQAGPWIGIWYLSLGGAFLVAWGLIPAFRTAVGLPGPQPLWDRLRAGRIRDWSLVSIAGVFTLVATWIIVTLCLVPTGI